MGVSTDGVIFYGMLLDEELSEKMETIVDNWENIYTKKHGIEDNSNFFNSEGNYAVEKGTPEYERREKIWEAYIAKRNKCLKKMGVVIGWHGSGEYPYYYIAISDTYINAHRGYPEKLSLSKMVEREKMGDYDQMLKDFCKKMEIPFKTARWYLVSVWL